MSAYCQPQRALRADCSEVACTIRFCQQGPTNYTISTTTTAVLIRRLQERQLNTEFHSTAITTECWRYGISRPSLVLPTMVGRACSLSSCVLLPVPTFLDDKHR